MPSGHPDRTKLRDLTPVAWGALAHLERAPMERYLLNPGVLDRLEREELIEEVWIEVRGQKKRHAQITEAGRAKLREHRGG